MGVNERWQGGVEEGGEKGRRGVGVESWVAVEGQG